MRALPEKHHPSFNGSSPLKPIPLWETGRFHAIPNSCLVRTIEKIAREPQPVGRNRRSLAATSNSQELTVVLSRCGGRRRRIRYTGCARRRFRAHK